MKYATYEAHITNIAVLPPYQNLGLGQMLIKTLIDEADKGVSEKSVLKSDKATLMPMRHTVLQALSIES